jgi:hypothetical protein
MQAFFNKVLLLFIELLETYRLFTRFLEEQWHDVGIILKEKIADRL